MEHKVMKLLKLLLGITAYGLTASLAFAVCDCDFTSFADELNERDLEAVTEYINSKRTIELKEKACNLSITGDIRSEWSYITEVVDGEKLRGGRAKNCFNSRVTHNDFDIDMNLYFEYKCERAWGVAQLEFDNSAGVEITDKICGTSPSIYNRCGIIDSQAPFGSGRCGSICLKRAYMGYNVCADGCSRFDIEIGRRRLFDVFDSRIQFLARFDGLLLRYATQWDGTDCYWNVGGFVVDERSSHFAWVTEIGFLNICDSGFDFKYSFIDWYKSGSNRCFVNGSNGWKFMNSQWTFAYHFDPDFITMPAKLYGAYLWNAAASRHNYTDDTLANQGFYIGFIIGEVSTEGDWSLDMNYQYVQAQAIPDPDVSGIGRGNLREETLTMAAPFGDPANARGNANYKGFRIEGLYALTDNLSLDAYFQYSKPCNANIGGTLNYSKFKIEAIYAF